VEEGDGVRREREDVEDVEDVFEIRGAEWVGSVVVVGGWEDMARVLGSEAIVWENEGRAGSGSVLPSHSWSEDGLVPSSSSHPSFPPPPPASRILLDTAHIASFTT